MIDLVCVCVCVCVRVCVGIRYVVDCGRSKQRILETSDNSTGSTTGTGSGGAGVARFEVRWISQAAAAQRAGRAGRTGPGHTYRLYSSSHYNDQLPQYTPPEIVNTPLEGVVLLLKSLGVEKVRHTHTHTHTRTHEVTLARLLHYTTPILVPLQSLI